VLLLDWNLIVHVLDNALSNARKYGGVGPLTVTVGAEGGQDVGGEVLKIIFPLGLSPRFLYESSFFVFFSRVLVFSFCGE